MPTTSIQVKGLQKSYKQRCGRLVSTLRLDRRRRPQGVYVFGWDAPQA